MRSAICGCVKVNRPNCDRDIWPRREDASEDPVALGGDVDDTTCLSAARATVTWSGEATGAHCGDAWAGKIVAVGAAARHGHRQRKSRAADEGAGAGREGTVGRLDTQALDDAPAGHCEVAAGVETGDLGDGAHRRGAEQPEGTADVLSMYDD